MEELKEIKKIKRKIFLKILICLIVMLIPVSIYIILADIIYLQYIFLGVFFMFILTLTIIDKNIDDYKTLYKRKLYKETFEELFDEVNADTKKSLAKSKLQKTKLIVLDNFISNNYFKAKYKNVEFEFANTYVLEEDKKSALFEGQWFIFYLNEDFKDFIRIYKKSFINSKACLRVIDGYFIQTKDTEFNKMFKVYVQDEKKASKILTSKVIQNIKILRKELKGNLILCFNKNELHIAIEKDKDLLEPSIFKPINIAKDKQKLIKKLDCITNLIDNFVK